jgi:hypothetical protein
LKRAATAQFPRTHDALRRRNHAAKRKITLTLGELLANLPSLPGHLVRDASAWCREGRAWALRIPLLLFMLYLEKVTRVCR